MRLPKGAQSDGVVIAPNITVTSATSELVNANSLKAYAPVVTQVPTGGTIGQVLTKISNADYDTTWSAPAGGMTQAQKDEIEALMWFRT